MTITLANMREKLNNILGDTITGITTSQGAADKTTLIDTALERYNDDYFKDYHVYIPSAVEGRVIKTSLNTEGLLKVYKPFTAQVAATIAYELSRYSASDKLIVLNQALLAAYPYFYKRLEDVSLTSLGGSDTEYAVPAAFADNFPLQVWLKIVTDSVINYERVYHFQCVEIAGAKKIYASLVSGHTILLVGETWLTQFSNEASTTELSDEEAEIVCLKAASNLYRRLAATVNSEESGRFEALVIACEADFDRLIKAKRMPILNKMSVDFRWAKA